MDLPIELDTDRVVPIGNVSRAAKYQATISQPMAVVASSTATALVEENIELITKITLSGPHMAANQVTNNSRAKRLIVSIRCSMVG